MRSFKENLKKFRHGRRMTQKQVAEEVGISQGTYSALEAGRFEPSLKTLRELAHFFETTLDELAGFVQFVSSDEPLTVDEENWLEHFHDMNSSERSLALGFFSVIHAQRQNPYSYLPVDMDVVDFREEINKKHKHSSQQEVDDNDIDDFKDFEQFDEIEKNS